MLTIYFKYSNGTQRIVMIKKNRMPPWGTQRVIGEEKETKGWPELGYKSQEKRNMVSSRASGTALCRGP